MKFTQHEIWRLDCKSVPISFMSYATYHYPFYSTTLYIIVACIVTLLYTALQLSN